MSSLLIDHISAAQSALTQNLSPQDSEHQADFSSWLNSELSIVNDQISTADTNLRQFALGQTDNLHEVMMSLEKAKTSFELVVEIRNRVLEGYQQIMRMQI